MNPLLTLAGSPYRSDGLLWLRGIAAFTVVLHHLGTGAALAATLHLPMLAGIALTGSYSVQIFFCLSGYLMVKILDQQYGASGYRGFYVNRLLRIIPVYASAIALSVLAWPGPASDFQMWPLFGLYYNYRLGVTFNNTALWTISTEMQFYLLCPLLFAIERRTPMLMPLLYAASMIAKVIYFMTYKADGSVNHAIYASLETNMIFFSAGWAAYRWRHILPRFNRNTALLLATIFLVLLWAIHLQFLDSAATTLYGSWLWIFTLPLMLSIAVPCLLPSLDSAAAASDTGIATRVLVFLGITSYAVYATHLAVVTLVQTGRVAWLAHPLAGLLACYATAVALYLTIERPAYRLRQIMTARR